MPGVVALVEMEVVETEVARMTRMIMSTMRMGGIIISRNSNNNNFITNNACARPINSNRSSSSSSNNISDKWSLPIREFRHA